jgi:hypothetical protein
VVGRFDGGRITSDGGGRALGTLRPLDDGAAADKAHAVMIPYITRASASDPE